MTREGGKPLVENADEVGWTAAAVDYYAETGRSFAGRVIPTIESTQLALVLEEPRGFVAAIVPWNYPLLLLAWKRAPALAAGNAVLCKPSELTPLSTLALAPCLDHLPPGDVYTRDLETVVRCMREIKAGTVWFNDPLTDNDAGPFGGFKQSALGRELGQEGLEAFQETKHVHIETKIAAKSWWYPYGATA
jgi:acyl-CoA reductase-like NAD-dependent aldehyde dehydrogenase